MTSLTNKRQSNSMAPFPCLSIALIISVLGMAGCENAVAVDQTTPTQTSTIKQLEIDVVPVVRSDVVSEIELVGSLIPLQQTTVVAEIDGSVAEIASCGRTVHVNGTEVPLPIDIGSHVKKGDVLVRLKDRDQRLALNVAQASQNRLESELRHLLSWRRDEEIAQLEATLEETKARAVCATADRQRYERLIEKKAISQADFDDAVAKEIQAKAEVKKAQAALQIAKSGPTKEEIEVAKAHFEVAKAEVAVRQDTLSKTIIRAPYDGVITKRYVDVGDRLIEMMDPNILDLVDSRVLFAEVPVPERYQMGVKTGQQARIMVDGLSKPIIGKIDRIDGNIDPQTRTFLIRVTIDNSQETLKPGGFARVALPVASTKDALTVPFSAVSFDAGQPSVFVYRDGRVTKKSVKLGVSNREKYTIISGVDQGELVAMGQIAVLSDGLRVAARKR